MQDLMVRGHNGVKLHCYAYGDRSRSPVLMLHGLSRAGDTWTPVADALAEQHWVLCLDQRGYNTSDRPGEYSFELMAADLVAVLDDLDLATSALVGHSMGGSVAYIVAEEHPNRITRLVIEDTPPPKVEWTDIPMPPDEPPEGWTVVFDWPLAAALTRQLNDANPRWWQRLPDIAMPTLIIGGGSTSHVSGRDLEGVAALIPDCRLVTFEGAGHNVHGTMPDEFLRVVAPFLRGEEIPDA